MALSLGPANCASFPCDIGCGGRSRDSDGAGGLAVDRAWARRLTALGSRRPGRSGTWSRARFKRRSSQSWWNKLKSWWWRLGCKPLIRGGKQLLKHLVAGFNEAEAQITLACGFVLPLHVEPDPAAFGVFFAQFFDVCEQCMGKTEARDKPPDRVEAADYGEALPVVTRFPLGIVKMKATTEDAVILADES
jgi:hypothetical protein